MSIEYNAGVLYMICKMQEICSEAPPIVKIEQFLDKMLDICNANLDKAFAQTNEDRVLQQLTNRFEGGNASTAQHDPWPNGTADGKPAGTGDPFKREVG